MASFIRNILGLWGGKVGEGVSVCQALVKRIQEGHAVMTEDEIRIEQLKQSRSRLAEEIQRYAHMHQGPMPPEMEDMLDELTTLLMQADDVIISFDVHSSRPKNRSENSGTCMSQNNLPGPTMMQYGIPSTVVQHTTSRLPLLDIPKFNGNILQFHEFWSKFTSIIEGRRDLTDVDKLTYLQLALDEGDAKHVIAGLATTNETYKIAVDALMEEYGEKGILIDAHYMALFNIPKATDDIKENKKVLTEIDRHFRVLNALGEATGNNNALRAISISKFSTEIQSDLRMMLNPNEENVEKIVSALKVIIKARDGHTQAKPHHNEAEASGSRFTTEALYSQEAKQNKRSNSNTNSFDSSRKRKANQPFRSFHAGKRTKPDNNGVNSNSSTSNSDGKSAVEPNDTKRQNSKPRKLNCIFCSGEHMHEKCTVYKTMEERRAKLTNRCYLCLRENHAVKDCKMPPLNCVHCGKKGHHNRCICPKKFSKANTNVLFSRGEHDTILQTAVAPVEGDNGKTISAKLLFDCGSQRSYIHASLAKRLGLIPREQTCLTVFTFGTTNPKNIPANLVNLRIKLKEKSLDVLAFEVPSTTGPLPSHTNVKAYLRENYRNLKWAADTNEDTSADVIIGNDYYYKFIRPERKDIHDNLHLINTELGWIPSGSFNIGNPAGSYQLSVLTYVDRGCVCGNEEFFVRPDPAIRNDDLRLLWELDVIGIKDSPKVVQDEEVIEFFKKTTKFVNHRYYVKWPWVEFPPNLPLNYGLSFGRLQSLFKRLTTNQKLQYNDVLSDQLKRGIIEEITEKKLPKTHPIHYLPHHCVLQENRSTKLRIVYDASAKPKGHCSLNELLYKGPLMLEDLTALLLKFRCHTIGITADVEKAFLQVGLQNEDRDVTRFLWVRDINKPPTESNLIHLRFCRVPFGVISSPFLLAATIRYHVLRNNTDCARKLANCLYVDNLVTGVNNRQEAIELYQTAKGCLNELSMNLRGWNSNDQTFLQHLPDDQRDVQKTISVLGLKWDTANDTLSLAFLDSKLHTPATTKRSVLRIIASVFDPCGFVAPLTLPTRMFLQNLWEKGLKWDSPLSSNEANSWDVCVNYLKLVPQFITQRAYLKSDFGTQPLQLHCFTDSSKDVYVAVVFIRMGSDVNYVISKSRVTPLQRKDSLTIPKLELLAVVIGTRLLNYVQRALELPEVDTYLWSDSQVVLGWLHTERLLPPWVSRRIGEVQNSKHIRFRYVPSHLNPADVATRPLQLSGIPDHWVSGPKFLRSPPSQWPSHRPQYADCSRDIAESYEANHDKAPEPTHALPASDTPPAYDWDLPDHGTILPLHTIKKVQQLYFSNEVSSTTTNLSKTLGVFTDQDGILRCKGRYQNAMLSYDQKYPILLPTNSVVTKWVIQRVHVDNYHVGVSHTLSLLRQQYWVLRGRSAVSSVLKHCPECVKYGGGPFKLPSIPDLPQERINYSSPFTYTGLDYLGPLVVQEKGVPCKRWVCLFTCLAIRAVHLEVVDNLSTEEFILCLRRFVATRGAPKSVISDNAAQFKLAASLLTAPAVQKHGIDWRFITELSPWQGGVYERLVGLVKHCLLRTIDTSMLNDSQLRTVLKEIEAVLNTRPLTSVGADYEQILTPAHFLRTCGPPELQPPTEEPAHYGSGIRQLVIAGWRRTRVLLMEFTRMFVNQYLLSLRERHCPTLKQPRVLSPKEPSVGDVVQVKGDTSNRGRWTVGKITSLSRGSDAQVRSAQVTLDNGTVLNRSIGHLYPLEMDIDLSGSQGELESSSTFPADNVPSPQASSPDTCSSATPPTPPPIPSQTPGVGLTVRRPPRREAAVRAGQQIRHQLRQMASSLFSLALSARLPSH